MRAVALDYITRTLAERGVPEPASPGPGEILFRVREVGICGTDRDLAAFAFGFPPAGERFMIPGHEALGQVIEVGAGVEGIGRGDWVLPSVRRPCSPACPSCARGRRDLCVSGKYTERGIFGAHGYLCEFALDKAEDVVLVPPDSLETAVLIEPLSVVEKAVDAALRYHEPGAKTALVLGAGPIGILAALTLQLRGLDVAVHSVEPAGHPRAEIVRGAGLAYGLRSADIVIEAAGKSEAAVTGFRHLNPLGVMCILGAMSLPDVPLTNMITGNQVVFGSVNASPESFAAAAADLPRFDQRTLRRLIRRVPFDSFRESVLQPPGAEAKLVHVLPE